MRNDILVKGPQDLWVNSRKTTQLGSHEEPQLDAKGKIYTAVVPNKWVLVYGRLVKTPRLEEDRGVRGCDRDDVPLVIIARKEEVHAFAGGGSPLQK